jgi:heme oxygenase (biliverdin-IX-beta and delta-forming)
MFAEILKERTLEAHASLEKKLVVHIKNVRSTASYVELLLLLYPFHLRASELLSAFALELPNNIPDPARAGNIRADLDHFGVVVKNESPDTPDMPIVDSVEAALGMYYVLEGSTMGGQIISRILSNSMNVNPDIGFSFFNPYQSQTVPRWEKFKSYLNAAADQLDQEQIISAANSFFNGYHQWIRLNEPARN